MVSACYQATIVALFVGNGTLVSIVMKIAFDTTAPGKDGTYKKFNKPWCAMFIMCLAMASVLLKYAYDRRSSVRSVTDTGASTRQVALKIAFPAFLQVFGTFLQAAGLMWISVSVYQMLQSSIIIFSALVRFLWMRKGLARFEACGIILTALGLSCVGVASVVSGNGGDSSSPLSLQILGIVVVLASQAILAVEAVMEERILQGFSMPPEFVCGMVGIWGLVFCLVIFLPLAQVMPGAEGNGLREDSIETLYMIKGSHTLQGLLLAFFVVILLYNHLARVLISITQATTMQVIGGLRTLSVWVVALLLYFQWPQYGERWVWSTWIELCGFLVLMFGVFLYRATFKLPCFEYPATEDPKPSAEIADDASKEDVLIQNVAKVEH